ncbi:hypothetical protein FRC03_012644 [Tulasnella sp. 419]|nr:hypothetical protein FRC03_012644 [Tulasnella sp. 419]
MSAEELTEWLESDASRQAGWQKDDGSGETIGHDRCALPMVSFSLTLPCSSPTHSGRKIVDILTRNPKKEPAAYAEHDIAHMRKVVSYCKRHLAQESRLKDTKSPEELEQTKSTKSLVWIFRVVWAYADQLCHHVFHRKIGAMIQRSISVRKQTTDANVEEEFDCLPLPAVSHAAHVRLLCYGMM